MNRMNEPAGGLTCKSHTASQGGAFAGRQSSSVRLADADLECRDRIRRAERQLFLNCAVSEILAGMRMPTQRQQRWEGVRRVGRCSGFGAALPPALPGEPVRFLRRFLFAQPIR